MTLKVVRFLAVILTALALIPGGAHLFALSNKIDLAAEQYFVVQGVYRGWNLFGFVLIPAVLVDLLLAAMLYRRALVWWPALAAGICMAGTLAIFFIWVYPANLATDFWTTIPRSWEGLRRQWEFGHAASGILTFVALCLVTVAALVERE